MTNQQLTKFQQDLWDAAIMLVGAHGSERVAETSLTFNQLVMRAVDIKALELACKAIKSMAPDPEGLGKSAATSLFYINWAEAEERESGGDWNPDK